MFRERLTRLAERRAHSRVITPVILETEPERLRDVVAEIMPIVERLPEPLVRIRLPEILPLGPYPMKVISRFSMVASFLPREIIFRLAENRYIRRIYSDEQVWAFQYPVVPMEGVFEAPHRIVEKIRFTSTFWTKKLIGADIANQKGFTGRDILVSIPDTGASRVHEQIRRVKFETTTRQYRDENGHGCIDGDSYLCLSNPGLIKIKNYFEELDMSAETSKLGLTKKLQNSVYTISLDKHGNLQEDRVLSIHKVPVNGEIVELTTIWHRKLRLTPWHKTFVLRDEEIEEVRADEVTDNDYIPLSSTPLNFGKLQKVKVLREKPHSRNKFKEITQEIIIDEDVAWLIGCTCGDGMIRRGDITLFDKKIEPLKKAKNIASKLGYSASLVEGKKLTIYSLGRLFDVIDIVWKVRGTGAGRRYLKKVPRIILQSPLSVRAAFAAGIFDAEGRVRDREHTNWSIGTIFVCENTSKVLCEGVKELLDSLGIPSELVTRYKKGRGWRTNRGYYSTRVRQRWNMESFLKIVGPHISTFKKAIIERNNKENRISKGYVKFLNDTVFVKVLKVERKPYNGYFYDLTTERYNNYYASGTFVHNTWCVSCVGGQYHLDDYLTNRVKRNVFCEGMAPECNLLAVKCLGYYIGTGMTSDIIQAVDISIKQGADVMSMSLGGPSETMTPEEDPFYPVMDEAVKNNLIPVIAAGNEGPAERTIGSPGCMPQVLTIGAYCPITGELANFSSRGPTNWGDIKPDCIAPGVNIDSAAVGLCDKAGDGAPSRYSPISGTSMATPHVSGIIALMRESMMKTLDKVLTVNEVKYMLAQLGEQKNNETGWGLINWRMWEEYLSTQYGVAL